MKTPSITHRSFLIGVIITGLLSWVAWFLVLTRMNPFNGGYLSLTLFYLTFFFGAAALFTLLGYTIRAIIYRKEIYFLHLNMTLRQGFLLAGLAFFMLLFQSYRVLTWWDSALLVLAAILLEFYFISRARKW